jgi:hypothetical protein
MRAIASGVLTMRVHLDRLIVLLVSKFKNIQEPISFEQGYSAMQDSVRSHYARLDNSVPITLGSGVSQYSPKCSASSFSDLIFRQVNLTRGATALTAAAVHLILMREPA